VQSSLPRLSNLVYTPDALVAGEVNTLSISVAMVDADGTTDDVRATVKYNQQQWEINLTDSNGDGLWTGTLELLPETSGRPSLKIIATDGVGEDANVETISVTLTVEDAASDSRPLILVSSLVALFGLLLGGAMYAARRKARLADLDLIESWDAFGSSKPVVALDQDSNIALEGGVVDGATEVEAEDSGEENESKPLTGADLDWDDV